MSKKNKLQEALKNVPYVIRDGARIEKGLINVLVKELHRQTNVSKADIFDFLDKETDYEIDRKDIE